jgi:hypothetical protein
MPTIVVVFDGIAHSLIFKTIYYEKCIQKHKQTTWPEKTEQS